MNLYFVLRALAARKIPRKRELRCRHAAGKPVVHPQIESGGQGAAPRNLAETLPRPIQRNTLAPTYVTDYSYEISIRLKPSDWEMSFASDMALLHKASDGRGSPFPDGLIPQLP